MTGATASASDQIIITGKAGAPQAQVEVKSVPTQDIEHVPEKLLYFFARKLDAELRVARETMAAIFEAWRDGYAEAIGELTPISRDSALAYFNQMIAKRVRVGQAETGMLAQVQWTSEHAEAVGDALAAAVS